MKDELNPKYLFNTTETELLVRIASSEIDAKELARHELDRRGLDPKTGKWKGFKK